MKLRSISSLLLAIILSAGCSHVMSPAKIPRIPEIGLDVVDKYQGDLSVELVNDQPDPELRMFAGISGHRWNANYNEWTQFFIDTWARELSKREVKVSEESPNKMKVKLENFYMLQGFWAMRASMTIHLESNDGKWSRKYEETDLSGTTGYRAFRNVIFHTIEKLLREPEVIDRMRAP